MSTQLFDWVHRKLGVDVTGQAEYEHVQRVDWLKKELENKEHFAVTRLQELKVELTQLMSIKSQSQKNYKGKDHCRCNDAVVITSDKLYFPLPLDKYIMNTVIARNLSETPVTFKMKATDPSRYAVKPRHGVIPEYSLVEITVTLRPTTQDPAMLHDKFLLECRHVHPTSTCPSCGTYVSSSLPSESKAGQEMVNGTEEDEMEDFSFPSSHSRSNSGVKEDYAVVSASSECSNVTSSCPPHGSCCSIRIKCKFTSMLPANFQLRRVSGEPNAADDTSDGLSCYVDDSQPAPQQHSRPHRKRSIATNASSMFQPTHPTMSQAQASARCGYTATRVNSNQSVAYHSLGITAIAAATCPASGLPSTNVQ